MGTDLTAGRGVVEVPETRGVGFAERSSRTLLSGRRSVGEQDAAVGRLHLVDALRARTAGHGDEDGDQ